MNKKIPAVSIIIPMYNAEKYIGECLDSILAQTFQDFEIIVVDDCSTDKSVEVVKNYFPKFNQSEEEKLKIIQQKINSGNPATPTNMGINFSRGEYLFLLDNDDAITETALEELYGLAKNFDADVVHCKRYYRFPADKNYFDKESRVFHPYLLGDEETPPAFVSEDISTRVSILNNGKLFLNLWTKLIRRDVIIKNNLRLINVKAQDMVFTCCLFLSAKKYLLVPNSVNLYRVVPDSLSHAPKTLQAHFHQWINGLIIGFNYFEKFLNEQEYFQQNLDKKFFMLDIWVRECCKFLQKIYEQIPAWQLDNLIRKEFEGNALMAFLFSRMNIFNVNMNRQKKIIQQLQTQINNK